MAEQTALFKRNMQFVGGRWIPRPGRPLTAFPSPTAPHIRVGRHAHALDVNSLDGGETRLERWIERQGVNWRNTVPGESWHGELSGSDLKKLARKFDVQRLSDKGVDFLVREEGLVPYAYNDPAGHATFGVGHLLHRGPVTAADRVKWGTKASPKPRSLAIQVLHQDIERFEKVVRQTVGRRVSQHQFDAMVSLAFNIGTGGFAKSTVARKSQARKPKEAADAFLMWDNPSMLRPRRERERRLFLTGKYK
jgi:lysozyme